MSNTLTFEENLTMVYSKISAVKNQEDLNLEKEENINKFLDEISVIKKGIDKRNNFISEIVEALQAVTWFDGEPTKDSMVTLKLLMATSKSYLKVMYKYYAKLNRVARKFIPESLSEFKYQLDSMKEVVTDLYDIFFDVELHEQFEKLDEAINNL